MTRRIAAPVLVAYALAMTLLNLFVFTGGGLLDMLAFLALGFSLFLADDARFPRAIRAAVFIGVMGVAFPLLGLRNTFYLDVATQVAIFAILALGLNIVVGFAGLLVLGYVAFFAIGAYVWAIFGSAQAGLFLPGTYPLGDAYFLPCLIAAFGLAGFAGMILGLPVLRLRGDYLAIVTLGFGEVVRILLSNLDKPVNITNGPQGITGIRQPLSGLAQMLGSTGIDPFRWQALIFYVLVVALMAAVIVATRRLDDSRIGRAWIAIREDEIAAQAMGVPLVSTKLLAFAAGASVAGAAGVIFAAKQTYVSPESFDFNQSIGILAMIVFGGLGSIRGAIIGAALVTTLNLQVLKTLSTALNDLKSRGVEIFGWSFAHWPDQLEPSKYERLIFGLILIVMMLYRPQGLVPPRRPSVTLPETSDK